MKTNWLDERIHLGEVPESSRTEALARSASEAGSRAEADLAASDAEILRRLPPGRMAERIEARRAARRDSGRHAWSTSSWIPLAVAACALLVAFFAVPPTPLPAPVQHAATPNPPDSAIAATPPPREHAQGHSTQVAAVEVPDDGIRVRGDGDLSILLVAPDGAAVPATGTVVGGSTLRIVAPHRVHGAVFSLDETGTIQRHWPVEGDSSRTVPAGPLPRDWETDPTGGWDRFVVVSSPTPFSLRTVEAHLRGLLASKDPGHRAISLPGALRAEAVLVERKAP